MISTRQLFTASGLALLFRLLGAFAMLAAQAVIANKLGGEQLGFYAIMLSACNIIAAILPFGFQTIAAYFSASYAAAGRGHVLRKFATQAYAQSLFIALAALLFGKQLLAFSDAGNFQLAQHWPVLVIAAFGLAIMQVSASILVSLKQAMIGLAGDTILRPLLTVAALATALAISEPQTAIATLFKLLAAGFVVLGFFYAVVAMFKIHQLPAPRETIHPERRQWWFFALPWTVLALASDFFFDIDLLLLTSFVSLRELAIFGIAAKLTSLAAFGVNSIYAISLPEFFKSDAQGDGEKFIRQVRHANRLALLMSLLTIAGAIVVAPLILAPLGQEFANASVPFAILCICPMLRAVFGPAALVLSLHQRPFAALPPVAIGFATLLACNALLVPWYQLNGAAISCVVATLTWSASLWLVAMRKTGIDVSLFDFKTGLQQPPKPRRHPPA